MPSEVHTYVCQTKDSFDDAKDAPAPRVLTLKVGALVIFNKNNNPIWINGTSGIVEELEEDVIKVRILNNDTVVPVIKDFKHLSDNAVNYIREAPYFFSLAFIIDAKNNVFSLDHSKQVLDETIKNMENWPKTKREEFIHKLKKLRNYLNRKEIDFKTLSNISITTHIMSYIIEFLLIKANAKHIIWISDRDKITDFQNGVISELVRIGYTSLLNKRVSNNEVYGFWGGKEYNKEIFDELVRIPDYISGAIASMDFEDVYKVSEKHYNLFDKSIVDNERIYIMHLKHNQDNDTLSNLMFTRI